LDQQYKTGKWASARRNKTRVEELLDLPLNFILMQGRIYGLALTGVAPGTRGIM
jgi:hypothetical protein